MKSILLLATLVLAVEFAVQPSEASRSPEFIHQSHHHRVHADGGALSSAKAHKAKYGDDSFECPSSYGYFKHPNCLKFWQCGNGIAYEMDCAPGTQWEQRLLTCVHLTTCKDGVAEPEEPENNPTTPAPVEPEEPAPEQPDQGEGFKCPSESGYFPHDDCWKFWQCGNWIAYEMTCAPGTQWSQDLLTCDHITTCQRPAEPIPEEPVEPEEPENNPTTPAPVEPEEPAPEQPDQGEGFKCPSESGYFPHDDCWKFWQCGNWIAYEMTCAPGTQWSQDLLTCDHITTCQRPAEPIPEVPEFLRKW